MKIRKWRANRRVIRQAQTQLTGLEMRVLMWDIQQQLNEIRELAAERYSDDTW